MGKYILTTANFPSTESEKFQVITPSRAIASHLKVPHISLESLAQNIVRRQGIGVASTLSSRRLLQSAVREIIQTKDIEGKAQAFLSTVKDLFHSGIDLKELQLDSDPRIKQLANLAIAYQNQLRESKRIDAAQLYWQGVLGVSKQQAYSFYGYFAPSQGELALIDAIAGDNSVLVLPLDELYPQNQQAADWLLSQGWEMREESQVKTGIGSQLQQCFKQAASTLPKSVRLNAFPSIEAEVRGVLAQVKVLQSQGIALPDIVLVAREEQLYGETIADIAWEYGLPVQMGYEIPLEQTRLGALIKLLLEVIRDNFPFEATAKLLSHPLVAQMSSELWIEARKLHPQGLAAWQELGIDLSLLDVRASNIKSFWLDRLLEILASWEVLEHAKAWAREVIAYYRLQEGLAELGRQADRQLTKQVFIQEITEILSLLTIPAQPGMGGVELHCPTSLLGTNYPYVFVLGAVEGILPKAIADDAILDFHNRKQLRKRGLNISTATDLALRETWDFYCLLNVPTQSLTFSYPEQIERSHSITSPYLSRLGIKASSVKNLPLASIEEARRLYLRQPDRLPVGNIAIPAIAHALQVEASRESAIAPDLYDGVIGVSLDPQQKIFSASQLTQLGQCPFKWFSAKLLKLKELPEAESDLSPAVRGTLYHLCLELAFAEVQTAGDLAKFNREQLTKAFAAAERKLELLKLPGWSAQRQEHLDLLALNLNTAEFLPAERKVIATETKFAMQWHGLQVKGQVDRIDRTDKGLAVIDYKTSGTTPPGAKDATGKANLDIQLAVYQDAIAERYQDEPIDTAVYYSLSKQKTISRPQKDPAELAAFAERVKTHLLQGHYPVAPDVDRQACRYCDYDLVCRRGDRLSRKPT